MHLPSLRVVALGGGTGLPVVLKGLKDLLFPREGRPLPLWWRDHLTAIVTAADEGGSSGRLRRAYGILAPGDIRNCLVALAEGDPGLSSLFQFRFEGSEDVGGHSLGNLILAALADQEADFARGIERASVLLGARGRVFPAAIQEVRLAAELSDGSILVGEARIAAARLRIRRLRLQPEDPVALPQACEALRAADLIVIGPGSLYTSVLPNLLVPGIRDAIRASAGRVIVVMNLMTEPGESAGYTASDHLEAILGHVPGLEVHDVLLNSAPIDAGRIGRYGQQGATPVVADTDALRALGCEVAAADLLGAGEKLRHDPLKLATALVLLASAGSAKGEARLRTGAEAC
jgi:uncharacterized cofD-like protein